MEYDLTYRQEPSIPNVTREQFLKWNAEEQLLYLKLKRESVSPTFETFRKPNRFKVRYGGRGA